MTALCARELRTHDELELTAHVDPQAPVFAETGAPPHRGRLQPSKTAGARRQRSLAFARNRLED